MGAPFASPLPQRYPQQVNCPVIAPEEALIQTPCSIWLQIRKKLGKSILLGGVVVMLAGTVLIIWQNPGEIGPFMGMIGGMIGTAGALPMRRASRCSEESPEAKQE